MIKYNAYEYNQPFRPNYESMQIMLYAGGAFMALVTGAGSGMPPGPFWYMAGICGLLAAKKVPAAWRLYQIQKNLGGRELSFITLPELQKMIGKHPKDMWLGYGFEWEQRHVQRMYEISKRDWAQQEQRYREPWLREFYRKHIQDMRVPGTVDCGAQGKQFKLLGPVNTFLPRYKEPEPAMGKAWIHGIEPREKTVYQPLKHIEGHTLIIGTTGAGKTRLFDLLISQCILRDETVIIVDPKGDKELAANAERACKALTAVFNDEKHPHPKRGRTKEFIYFNPAFPEKSARLNPLRNFSRVTEVASRISALMQSANGGSDPFKAFSWQALNNVVQGLAMIEGRPTLTKIKHFLEGGAHGLVCAAMEKFIRKNKIDLGKYIKLLPDSGRNRTNKNNVQYKLTECTEKDKADALVDIYNLCGMSKDYPNSDLEGLVSMYEHDTTHFSKMVANLLPIMNMLTSGVLGPLLSPDPNDTEDRRPSTDTQKIIQQKQVAYIGLDSLTDSIVGSAIGSMILSDLTAVAGQRYNYGQDLEPVNIFVDEAAETINEPLIAMLNKGRGAKMRLYVATQTIADFAARLGSQDKAMQVLGNVNNTIALRTIDQQTQEYICETMPKTRIEYVMRGQSQSMDSEVPVLHSGGQNEVLREEEADMFPAPMLGSLPNLEYIAKISGGKIVKGRLPILIDDPDAAKEEKEAEQQKLLEDARQRETYPEVRQSDVPVYGKGRKHGEAPVPVYGKKPAPASPAPAPARTREPLPPVSELFPRVNGD